MSNSDDQIMRIFEAWHAGVKAQDATAIAALYTVDGVIETPAAVLLSPGHSSGIVRGREEIRDFFAANFRAREGEGVFEGWWRNGSYLTDGKLLTWEYPRDTPHGDQTDLVESVNIENGLIAHHRVYWGWVGFLKLVAAMSKPGQ